MTGFTKKSRLLTAADYTPVFQQPDYRVSNRHLLLLVRHSSDDKSRLGLVVSKKNARLAVQRNRIKRIIREAFRARQAGFGNTDLVMLARPGLDKRNSQEIRQLCDALFDELQQKLPKNADSRSARTTQGQQ